MAAKRFVLVAGNIGAGKTSLTQKLAEKLGWLSGFETVEQNPYLGKFYGDMRAWAFHLQVFLLGQRADQHIAAHAAPQSYILDRSIYEDYHIFARALHELGNLNDEDLATYRRVYQLVIEHLPRPDLLVFLRAPVDALLARIQARGRAMEAGISADYLQLLDRFYAEWLASFDLCPVLTVPSGDWDFVNRPQHLELVTAKIQEKLSGKDDVVFPEA
ncbi:MAG: deoxynucleoside kinase [Anaerolineales bacterium]|nr:deoxynucleoside kinase [Anaerolineales bacterium]